MKRSKQCPKCQSLRIGHIAFQVDANDVHVARDEREDHQYINAARQAVSRSLGIQRTVQRLEDAGRVLPLVGQLEAYVCTECGYHETYVRDPRSVPWHDLQGFTWVNSEPPEDGPFR
ncbi:MAG: hypothetical protein AB7T06_34395 [Kofleriaceae bacterium]